MGREIPEAVRAAAGLAATLLDEARKLPETLPGLPVRAIGAAMQASMRLQQQYAGLIARGDELFTGLLGEDEPGMATFDDEVEPEPRDGDRPAAAPPGFRDSAFDRAAAPDPGGPVDSGDTLTSLLDDPAAAVDAATEIVEQLDDAQEVLDELAIEELVDTDPAATLAPVDGYDGLSIAQLRGRLRGFAPVTVESLLTYEQANRAREPYLRMLRNRLERVRPESGA